ncbi:MAG: bifunctional 4-hydroxy-2-oxoglutarate aldolase/2-dehydro-3-deoxy-phosphogluconate aldolase [Desulfobacterales bacterium]|nr:bifunctional 4-hydroxy-2-oxoglutarate aldolase/2-dehydro-3-deoxy-phosphogluconate aldolase [Desulfobacterales bacterium]
MNNILDQIASLRLVPVVKIENSKDAIPLGQALLRGALPLAEITYRTTAAEAAIQALTAELPQIVVGAGTVLSIDQVRSAVDAGARFIVAPGFNPTVVDYCLENNICVVPGVNNPSQIERAIERKLKVIKFFPAEASGGLPFLKAVAAPYGDIQFMPTGGINLQNLLSYLSFPRVIACGGSWMVETSLISAGNFEEIEKRTREAVAAIAKESGPA